MLYRGVITQNSLSAILIVEQDRAMNTNTFCKGSHSMPFKCLSQYTGIILWEK